MASRKERCTFCGRGYDQVPRLVAGPPDVYICNECVDLCNSILQGDGVAQTRVPDERSVGHEQAGERLEQTPVDFGKMERLWPMIPEHFRASLLRLARAAADEPGPENDGE